MYIYSAAFHTSYQYALSYVFPDIFWTFEGDWTDNRPMPANVSLKQQIAFEQYDLYLAHSPLEFARLTCRLEERGIPRERIVYIAHWALQPQIWEHLYDGVSYEQFLRDVSNSAIVCVSHFMVPQFRFYSNVCVQAIPHFVPEHVFGEPTWQPGQSDYINIVNKFYASNRGVGAAFWDSLDFVNKKLYGDSNGDGSAGPLKTVAEFRDAVSKAAGFLWTADAVAISFAPLEAMLLGCPVVAPRNLDWPMFFDDRVNIVLYDEGSYSSCKEAVQYLERNPNITQGIALRGRDAVLRMNSASLFRERWSRVIDAARAATHRGQRRLADEAEAPLSHATTVHPLMPNSSAKETGQTYALITPLQIDDNSISVFHPAETWNMPRQFIRKYGSLEKFTPAKYAAISLAAGNGACVFDIGRDIGYYGYLAASKGAEVFIFNRSPTLCKYSAQTAKANGINAAIESVVFDVDQRRVSFSPFHSEGRGEPSDARTEETTAITIDQYVEAFPGRVPSLMIIDDPGYEARIVEGAVETLKINMPELLITCYRHAAYANGAPDINMIRMLSEIGYSLKTCDWNADSGSLVALNDCVEPQLDAFLLHATINGRSMAAL